MKQKVNYIKHLQRYFDAYYGKYEESAEWEVDPAVNQWEVIIRELGIRVTLTCDDNGRISEEREKMWRIKPIDRVMR